jgi:hypothetical protein
MDAGEPVTVAHLPREEAWLMAGRLRADGVPAEVVDRTLLGSVYGGAAAVGLYDVIVPRNLAEEAGRIVRAYTSSG